MHGFVEERFDVRPVSGGGVHGIHLGGNLFAQLAASFTADDINRGAASNLIEPCRQNCARSQLVRVLRQIAENGLRYLLGQLRRPDLPQRRRIDQVEVPLDQCGKSLFGVPAREFLQ